MRNYINWLKSGGFLFTTILMASHLIAYQSSAQSTNWVAPKEMNEMKSTLKDKNSAVAGKAIYMANCTPCHGNKGKGDGPSASALTPRPADHTSTAVQNETDGSLFWKISEGRNAMPGYKKIFSEQQRWELVAYIRLLSIKPGKK